MREWRESSQMGDLLKNLQRSYYKKGRSSVVETKKVFLIPSTSNKFVKKFLKRTKRGLQTRDKVSKSTKGGHPTTGGRKDSVWKVDPTSMTT